MQIGITERGDAGLDNSWMQWVFAEKKPAILISKNPKKLLAHLSSAAGNVNFIIHCTITGFGGTKLEPNVPVQQESLEIYDKLIDIFGPNRVVLRVDPIIPTSRGIITAEDIIKRAKGRVRISFIDMYPHVKQRFREVGLPLPFGELFHAKLELRQATLERLQTICECKIEVCGEPDMECTGCVSKLDLDTLGLSNDSDRTGHQRFACACLAAKFELLSNKKPCNHNCLYCYWR